MPRKEHHVVPNPDGGWDVKRENAKRSSGHYDTKQEAMDAGRRMSINQGTELIPTARTVPSRTPAATEMTRVRRRTKSNRATGQQGLRVLLGLFIT